MITVGAAAFLATVLLTPVAQRMARRWDVMDHPGPLKIQKQPLPYLGGIAIYGGLFAGVVAARFTSGTLPWQSVIGYLAGGTVLAATGLRDDVSGLSPLLRLMIECGAGIAFVALAGVPRSLAIPLSLLFPVGCNAVNLTDGQDGLAGSMAVLFGIGGLWLGLWYGDLRMALLSSALIGACLGFLLFNWNPASILMGDCGSLLLGFWIAGLAVEWILGGPPLRRGVQMGLLFAFPLIDMGLAILRRLVRRQNVFEGDRDHIYDCLARTRLGIAGSTCFCVGMAAVVAGVGVWLKL